MEVIRILIGLDVHKRRVYITEIYESGSIGQQYEIGNDDDSWKSFRDKYLELKPEISLEISTSGKYVARLLRDMGFTIHPADPTKLTDIHRSGKKNDKEDSMKLARYLHRNELPEVWIPSRESDDLRSLVRYRKSLGEDITMIKNRVHAILTSYGIRIQATDIFGKSGLIQIEHSSGKIRGSDRIVISDMLQRVSDLMEREAVIEDQISRSGS